MEVDAAARGQRRVRRKVLDPVVQDIMTEVVRTHGAKRPKKAKPDFAKAGMQSRLAELAAYKDYFKVAF
jgi:hypothetical protein